MEINGAKLCVIVSVILFTAVLAEVVIGNRPNLSEKIIEQYQPLLLLSYKHGIIASDTTSHGLVFFLHSLKLKMDLVKLIVSKFCQKYCPWAETLDAELQPRMIRMAE